MSTLPNWGYSLNLKITNNQYNAKDFSSLSSSRQYLYSLSEIETNSKIIIINQFNIIYLPEWSLQHTDCRYVFVDSNYLNGRHFGRHVDISISIFERFKHKGPTGIQKSCEEKTKDSVKKVCCWLVCPYQYARWSGYVILFIV